MEYEFETRCIHSDASQGHSHPYGAITSPIYLSSTFAHPGIGQSTGYDYTRESNPTRSELEQIIASLENAADAIATSSGMAAVTLAFSLLGKGDHVICSEDLYGGSVRLFSWLSEKRGLDFSFINTADEALTEQTVRSDTKALYIETPSNPTMQITDLRKMKRIAHRHHLLLIVDNTFLTPYLQQPMDLGADLVIHSGTKYLAGHNDVLAGFVAVKDPKIARDLRFHYKTVGYSLSPFDSYLVLRGLKTLAVRMDRQQENAQQIAQFLKKHPKIRKVNYIGLEESPGFKVNQSQASGCGAMISFQTDSEETAKKILEKVRLIQYAESLGGVESLITYPMLQTHGDVPADVRERLGITSDFLRLSVGLENACDLIRDLEAALA